MNKKKKIILAISIGSIPILFVCAILVLVLNKPMKLIGLGLTPTIIISLILTLIIFGVLGRIDKSKKVDKKINSDTEKIKRNESLDPENKSLKNQINSNSENLYRNLTILKTHFDEKKYNKAVSKADEIISQYGDIADVYDIRAMSLTELGYYLDAIDDFSNDIRLHPNNANTYFLRGMAKEQISDLEAAKTDLEKALELNPNEMIYKSSLFSISMKTDNPILSEMFQKEGIDQSKLIRREK